MRTRAEGLTSDEGAQKLEQSDSSEAKPNGNPSLSAIFFLDVISPQENPFGKAKFTSPTLYFFNCDALCDACGGQSLCAVSYTNLQSKR